MVITLYNKDMCSIPDSLEITDASQAVNNRGPNASTILPETQMLLDKFYKPFNAKLANILGDSRFMFNN